jgi:glucan phosphoethanolaminetransferase (alkaline phosphatase superfamily)
MTDKFAVFLLLLMGVGVPLTAAESVSSKPNFVIIIGDDSSFHDYGFNGSPNVNTPHLDQLGAVMIPAVLRQRCSTLKKTLKKQVT